MIQPPQQMNPQTDFTESEIEKARELKRLKFPTAKFAKSPTPWVAKSGHYVFARHCPEGCQSVQEQVHLVISPRAELEDTVWLPRMDDLLEVAKNHQVSFSQITDYLHRKRFADKNEREGLYQLFIELLR